MTIASAVLLPALAPGFIPNRHPNQLIQAMTPVDAARILAAAIEVELVRGVDLGLPQSPLVDCWFPLAGLLSVIAMAPGGQETEVAVIGFEGFADVAQLLGADRASQRLLVQIPGRALRVKASAMRGAMHDSPALTALMLAYVQVFTTQVADTALANAQFDVQQRLARWLLMCGDRVGPHGITLTHESMSIMLGVRRAGITVALHRLVALGSIVMQRGAVDVTDRTLLLHLAGGCYGGPEAEYQRMIG